MKIIGFVPVRGGSVSIPLKNIKLFCGKPLLYWVLQAMQESDIHEIYVATDSLEIKNITLEFGFSKVKIYDRLPQNAQNTSSTESVMLEFLNANKFMDEDLFVLVQATSPFTTSTNINEALAKLELEQGDSLLSATIMKRFLWDTKTNQPLNYDYTARPRRQDFEGYFMENGAFYINKIKNIIKYKNRLSGKISIYEMEEHTSIEIDENIDWIIAEAIMKNLQNKNMI